MSSVHPPLFGHAQEVSTSDDYYTPAWLFQTMGIHFDLDVAAPPGGVPWIPCRRYLTMEDDGLSAPWEGQVWMNPPYSRPEPWVQRFIDHGNGVALLPFTRSRWGNLIWDSSATIVRLNYDFEYVRDGRELSIMWAPFLAAFGDDCRIAIERIGVARVGL